MKKKLLGYILLLASIGNLLIIIKYLNMREYTQLEVILSRYSYFSFIIPSISLYVFKSLYNEKSIPTVVYKINKFVNILYLIIFGSFMMLILFLAANPSV